MHRVPQQVCGEAKLFVRRPVASGHHNRLGQAIKRGSHVNLAGMRIASLLGWLLTPMLTSCGGGSPPYFKEAHPRISQGLPLATVQAALDSQRSDVLRAFNVAQAWKEGTEVWGFRGIDAVFWGRLTGDPEFCERAVAQIDAYVAAEEALLGSGGVPTVAHDSYLEAGELIGDVMGTYDGCHAALTSEQGARWLAFAEQAVFNIWNPELAAWAGQLTPWSGWSINNPSNNYYYSFLRATVMFGLAAHGESAYASDMLAFVRNDKLLDQLPSVLTTEVPGGGSREGTGYGVAMQKLFELYDIWQSSTQERLADLTPHTKASLVYMMHAIVPTLDAVAPIGDHSRDSTAALFDYHRNYLQLLTHLYATDPLADVVSYQLSQSSVSQMETAWMAIYDALYARGDGEAEEAPADKAYFAAGTGHLFARSSWAHDAVWFSGIGGPFTESHAHQDQGSFLLYKNAWQAVDPNVFGPGGLQAGVDRHNLVYIEANGSAVPMRNSLDTATVGLHRGSGFVHQWIDVSPAYRDSAVHQAERQLVFLDEGVLVVADRVESELSTTHVWQATSPSNGTIAGGVAQLGDLRIVRLLPKTAVEETISTWAGIDDLTGGYRYRTRVAGGDVRHLYIVGVGDVVQQPELIETAQTWGVRMVLSSGRNVEVVWTESDFSGRIAIDGLTTELDRTIVPWLAE